MRGKQSRSVYAVGGAASYSVLLHTVRAVHSRSLDDVGGLLTNSLPEHTCQAAHGCDPAVALNVPVAHCLHVRSRSVVGGDNSVWPGEHTETG